MKKNNPKIKEVITIKDMNSAVETVVNIYFQVDEDGNEIYTPYFSEIGEVTAIANYFIEGVEFDENENIYESVCEDGVINTLVQNFKKSGEYDEFIHYVEDKVDYRKKMNIATLHNEATSILTYKLLELIEKEHEKSIKEIEATENLNNWIKEQREQQERLNSIVPLEAQKNFIEKFDVDDIVRAVYKEMSESELHKKNKEIVDANRKIREQDDKIIEMQKAFAKEKQKDSVKNVLADKK